jgi:O-antigen/teichoic acid export membrane protein
VAALALFDCLIIGGMSFVTVLVLGRFAGPDELGVFALVVTIFYLLLAVQESLITMPYTVLGARLEGDRRRQYSGAALCQSVAWSVCVSTILALVAVGLLLFGDVPSLARVLGVFAAVLPLWSLREFGRRYLFAHMQVTTVVILSIIGSTAQLIVLCAITYSGQLSASTALLAIGIGCGISGIGWFWSSRAALQFNHRRWPYFARKNWIFGRWILASHATAVLGGNAMPWLIVAWLGPAATGVFAACDAILRFANPIVVSLSNILTPRVAIGLQHGGKAELRRIVRHASALISLFLLAFCAFLVVGGRQILARSFGADYEGAWTVLVVLGVSQLVARLALAPSRALLVLDLASANLCAEATGLVAAVVAAALLIPLYGIVGAAFAQLAGSLALAVVTIGAYANAMREGREEGLRAIGSATASPAPIGGCSE